ncbi:hypothetical protein [Sporosarcina sp. Marseille-Q4943]|uniref:hypothetical protein n=1 Tax=Sporosarcina sp. Marseille-Q4943 TaxID=2942204 RepID=UPI00208DAC3B|nr:hypothetical protein [Sporosarcina sp. Marseille-Q4943]
MGKVFSKKVLSTVVASSLLFGSSGAVVTAAPKADTKQTGLSASTVSQKNHVPYITSTVAENTKWAYNRSSNQFILTYDKVEYWSVGKPVVTAAHSVVLSGLNHSVKIYDTILLIPTANQDFTFSPEATWKFDAAAKRYSATFTIFISDSKGVVRKEVVTRNGLLPGQVHELPYSLTDKFGTITKKVSYKAPATPVDVGVKEVKNLKFNTVQQNKNQIKVEASYQLVHSDGTVEAKKHYLDGNFGNPGPGSKSKNPSTRKWEIAGYVYKVTVHYDAKKKTHYATYENVGKD